MIYSVYVQEQYLKTYVQYKDKWFFVSTINRLDSADYPIESSETMAWEWDHINNKRGNVVFESSGVKDSPTQHFLCVENILSGDFEKLEIKDESC